MKIGVDMDEVIADLLSAYINFLNTEYNLGLTRDRFNGYYTWDTWDRTLQEKFDLFDIFYQTEHFKNVQPIAGAHEAIHALKEHHDLYIVTSRPAHIVEDTLKWLDRYFPNVFTEVHFVDYVRNKKKADICKEIGVELMIEDCRDYALNCAAHNIRTYLIDYPWNAGDCGNDKIRRVRSWNEIVPLLS
jgi:5'(3')-deoxyribonucleotidase